MNAAQYLTPQDLSDRWEGQIKVRTLTSWRQLGRGPDYLKIGTRIVYRLEAVEAYERAHTVARVA